ncbi:MAG TPA: DinB family protein [Terriglobales bacterium]|nr:DinB family protein [Terriglobales bacterium]
METVAEYKARIMSYVEGKDAMAVQRETASALAQLIAGASSDKLTKRPDPAKWSVAEVLAHLADAEIGAAWRYRQMIEHNGGPLSPFDQELWHKLGNYASASPAESLELFRLLRASNLRMFERLTPEQWERYGMHAERGKMSVRDLAQQIAGHDVNHLEQIRKILT